MCENGLGRLQNTPGKCEQLSQVSHPGGATRIKVQCHEHSDGVSIHKTESPTIIASTYTLNCQK